MFPLHLNNVNLLKNITYLILKYRLRLDSGVNKKKEVFLFLKGVFPFTNGESFYFHQYPALSFACSL